MPSPTRGRPVGLGSGLYCNADRGPLASIPRPRCSRTYRVGAPASMCTFSDVSDQVRLSRRAARRRRRPSFRSPAGLASSSYRARVTRLQYRQSSSTPSSLNRRSCLLQVQKSFSGSVVCTVPISPAKNTRAQSHGWCRGFWALGSRARDDRARDHASIRPLASTSRVSPAGQVLMLWARLPSCERLTISRRGTRAHTTRNAPVASRIASPCATW